MRASTQESHAGPCCIHAWSLAPSFGLSLPRGRGHLLILRGPLVRTKRVSGSIPTRTRASIRAASRCFCPASPCVQQWSGTESAFPWPSCPGQACRCCESPTSRDTRLTGPDAGETFAMALALAKWVRLGGTHPLFKTSVLTCAGHTAASSVSGHEGGIDAGRAHFSYDVASTLHYS